MLRMAQVHTQGAVAAAPVPTPEQQPPPPAAAEDQWTVNKPVERRTQALNEEMSDCLGCFWSWVTCGGPAARVRQLYVQGRLSRCMDEYIKFKNCMVAKLDPDKTLELLPGPHPLWRIRTRKQAGEFWREQYAHLGAAPAAAQPSQEQGTHTAGGASSSSSSRQPDITAAGGRS
jgi:hypothetical protein